MFTGLIEGVGKVKSVGRSGAEMTVSIESSFPADDVRIGDSISVDGVCLTVTKSSRGVFSTDVSGETVSRSTLAYVRQGNEVNLERALRLTDRLGGHLVSGHVDGVGKIVMKEQKRRSWMFRIEVEQHLSRYIIEKGSIAVDGISLTVNRCDEGFFDVNIIPETGRETTILKKKVGDKVNIETDLIGKYVEKLLTKEGRSKKNFENVSTIDLEKLMNYGFGE